MLTSSIFSRKYLSLFFVCFLLISCSTKNLNIEQSAELSIVIGTKGVNQDSYVYHAETDLVLQRIPKDILNEKVVPIDDSQATHLAIKFYPRNSDEIFKIKEMDCISQSYIPFGFNIAKKSLQTDQIKNKLSSLNDTNPHQVLLKASEIDAQTNCLTTAEIDDRYVTLPVIYAICPIDFVIPDEIEHDVCYALSIGDIIQPSPPTLPLKIVSFDSLLGRNVPLNKIKISAQFGSISANTYTNSNGIANICTQIYGVPSQNVGDITISIVLETDKWIINRSSTNSAATHIVLGTVRELWPSFAFNPVTYNHILTSENKEFEAHRALDYYYYDNHPLAESISTSENGVTVHCVSESSNDYLALTYPSTKNIIIYNSNYSQNVIIGTSLHELGHIRHYAKIGNSDTYSNSVQRIVKESFASFIGWALGEEYYLSKGFVKPYQPYHINSNHRQNWYRGSYNADYSPLFIDLVDDYNQGLSNGSLPFDEIESVPYPFIDNIVNTHYTLDEVFNHLHNFAGIYFSTEALESYENAF